MNRNVSALAAYRLKRGQGASQAVSFQFARRVVEDTQFEYARWNRPRLFRGKKSVVFLFMNYVQNVLFFALGGSPGAMRFWYVMMLTAGIQGLPFAEDLLDVLDFIGTKLKTQLGWKNPKVQSRLALREFVKEMVDNPDLILHGLSRQSFGMVQVGEHIGIPIPSVDMSASISLGDLTPLEQLNRSGRFEERTLRVMERGGGAVASGLFRAMKAVYSDDPDSWKRAERMLPVFMQNMSKAARLATRGKETTRRGEVIAEFDPYDALDAAELLLQAAGFTPTRRSAGWEKIIAKREVVEFYKTMRSKLVRDYVYGREIRDRELIADAFAAVRKYNKQVPFPEMKISNKALGQAFKTRFDDLQKAQRGFPQQDQFRRLDRSIEEVFEEPAPGDK